MDKPLWGLRAQAPFGAVGIGTGAWTVLSSIPEGACACGAEGHMASIGSPALGAKGCAERLHRFAQGAADWRSGPRWSILSVLCPVHPFPLRGTSPRWEACHWICGSRGSPMNPVPLPPQGETRDMRGKTGSHTLHVPFRSFPLWWLAPPPFPRKRGHNKAP